MQSVIGDVALKKKLTADTLFCYLNSDTIQHSMSGLVHLTTLLFS